MPEFYMTVALKYFSRISGAGSGVTTSTPMFVSMNFTAWFIDYSFPLLTYHRWLLAASNPSISQRTGYGIRILMYRIACSSSRPHSSSGSASHYTCCYMLLILIDTGDISRVREGHVILHFLYGGAVPSPLPTFHITTGNGLLHKTSC